MPDQPALRSILVIKPSSLGDVVHTLPAVVRLKQAHPSCRITWLINPEWAPLLDGNPTVDETIDFPRRDFGQLAKWPALLRWARKLHRLAPDVVCDFQGLLRSGLLARLARGKVIYGLSDAREGAHFFYDRIAEVTARQHAVRRYLTLAGLLCGDEEPPARFPLPAGTRPARFDLEQQPFVLFHPVARGSGKSLERADIAAFCEALQPLPVVLVGQRGGPILAANSNCVDLTNATNLHELIWLVRRAAFTVSVDSGPMHIAAAITDYLLSIHTWSDPKLVGPYNPKAWIWKDRRIVQMQDYHGATPRGMVASNISQVAAFVRQSVGERAGLPS